MGLTSVMALDLFADLSRELGRPLPSTLAWDCPTVDACARHLAGGEAAVAVDEAVGGGDEPIAVIGLACRLPGAPDADAYWRLLCEGRDAVGEVPAGRWDVDAYYDADRAAPGKMNTRWGGFLEGVDRFDPAPFGISPREAAQVDPQQRLMLELAWEALDDAGVAADRLRDSRTGVFCGAMNPDYARLGAVEGFNEYSATGQDGSIIAARISYTFGLQGPSLVVNTACSSSLVAVHLACQSLRAGESTLALAGGVNALLAPESTVAMTKFGGMSPGGRSRSFDVRADGYVRAEGGGLVVLKRLSRALADGDPVWCVLRGSAVNNDGFSNGLTAPNPRAQEALLRDAYGRAGVAPGEVQYVEAHGTGTVLGDPIEAKALGAVLGVGREPGCPLLVGSVKTNVGHLEAAAGIAGLIKVALSIRYGRVPGNLHFEAPNPHIPFDDLRLRVARALAPWPRPDEPRVAGVSSFGFGGTNCHVVASEPPSRGDLGAEADAVRRGAVGGGAAPRLAFVFSGNGSQWAGMGRQLVHASPLFRARVAECDRAMRGLWRSPSGRSLLDELCAPPTRGRALPVDVEQPLLFAVQVGLTALWASWGVEPDAVVGHSVGEVAAAWAAGALDLEQAARVVVHRSRLQAAYAGRGAMALVACPPEALGEELARGLGDLAIAGVNTPGSTALSGSPTAIEAAVASLEARGVACRRVRVDVAYHGPQMDGAQRELPELLAGLSPRAGWRPMTSTVTGDWLDSAELGPDYWGRNLRQPVLFAGAIGRLLHDGYRCFLEVGPHPVLTEWVRACAEGALGAAAEVEVVGSLHRERDAGEALLASLGAILRRGRGAAGAGAGEAAGAALLPLSAHSPGALAALSGRLADWLEGRPETDLRDVCFTAGARRAHRGHRLAVVASSRPEAIARLRQASAGGEGSPDVPVGRAAERGGLVFVFPGQGCQWAGMARGLLARRGAFPAFGEALEACDRAMRAYVPWSVVELLASGRELRDIDVVQPAIFAVQVALTALWRSWGVEPDAVVGQSMGEVAAACVAGALDVEAAARVVCRRSRLLRRVRGRGAMALVALSLPDAERALRGRERELSVAVSSGPAATVIAGEPAALREVLAALQGRNVYCQPVEVDVASHSPQVDELLGELRDELRGLGPGPARVPMYSTVEGAPLVGAACGAEYWARNLREPVRFAEVVRRLVEEGHETFVEVSPHPVALRSVEDGLRHARREGLTLPSLRRDHDEGAELLRSLGTLYARGQRVEWGALHPDGSRHLRLPAYPWERRSFWLDARRRPAGPRVDAVATGREAAFERTHPEGEGEGEGEAWVYEVVWRRCEGGAGAPGGAAGTWVLCADRGGVAAGLSAAIAARGGRTVVLASANGAALAAAVRAAADLRAVVHLASLDLPASNDYEPAQLLESEVAALAAVAGQLAALVREASAPGRLPRFWVVTQGAQPAGGAVMTPRGLAQAPLWGGGRVAALEHPEMWGGLVDLDPDRASATQAERLLDAMLEGEGGGEDQAALREGGRLVPRLVPRRRGDAPAPVSFRGDGTYLITGGLGALGRALAHWLVDRGARHLALLGRGCPERGAEHLAALGARGAQVRYWRADVADDDAVTASLAELERSMPPLRGVFHAAGVLAHEPLAALGAGREVLAPKVAGGWVLHRRTMRLPLDGFVLFSSASSVWGASGQAHYAAANHVLDALAHHRRGLGLPALSVNWGLWAGEGVGAQEGGGRAFADAGLVAMEPSRALDCLGRLLAEGDVAQATVACVDWRRFKPIYEARRRRPLLAEVEAGGASAGATTGGETADARALREAPLARRRERLREHVRGLVAGVLGLDSADAILLHDGFFRLGMSSLTAVELAKRVQASLGCRLPSTVSFDYPSVEALSDYLATAVLGWAEPAEAAPAPAPSADAPPEGLSEGDLLALLSERLGRPSP